MENCFFVVLNVPFVSVWREHGASVEIYFCFKSSFCISLTGAWCECWRGTETPCCACPSARAGGGWPVAEKTDGCGTWHRAPSSRSSRATSARSTALSGARTAACWPLGGRTAPSSCGTCLWLDLPGTGTAGQLPHGGQHCAQPTVQRYQHARDQMIQELGWGGSGDPALTRHDEACLGTKCHDAVCVKGKVLWWNLSRDKVSWWNLTRDKVSWWSLCWKSKEEEKIQLQNLATIK